MMTALELVVSGIFGLVGIGIGLLIVVGSAIFHGYVLSMLWKWFVVPTFGMPQLGIVPAIGLVLLADYLISNEKNKVAIAFGLVRPAFILVLGYIVHLFM